MNPLREKRNKKIITMFVERRSRGIAPDEVIKDIAESHENESWCLAEETIRRIIYDKNYGARTQAQRS